MGFTYHSGTVQKDSNCDFKNTASKKRSHSNDIIFMPKRYKDFMKTGRNRTIRRFPVFDDVKNRMKNDIAYQNSRF